MLFKKRKLFSAIKKEETQWAKELIADDPNLVNASDRQGNTPLHFAAPWHLEDMTTFLLKTGADANARNKREETALHGVASMGDGGENIAQLLLDHGADINAQDREGHTPLDWAIESTLASTIKMERFIQEHGAKRSLNETLIDAAVQNDDIAMSDLLDRGADPNSCTLKHGVTILMLAAGDDRNAAIVEKLLERGAEINATDPECGRTALMMTARDGHYSIIEVLLMMGARLNMQDKYGKTALMFAAQNGHVSVVEDLLAKGARVNTRDMHGKTAFTYADKGGHYRTMTVLKNAGGEP